MRLMIGYSYLIIIYPVQYILCNTILYNTSSTTNIPPYLSLTLQYYRIAYICSFAIPSLPISPISYYPILTILYILQSLHISHTDEYDPNPSNVFLDHCNLYDMGYVHGAIDSTAYQSDAISSIAAQPVIFAADHHDHNVFALAANTNTILGLDVNGSVVGVVSVGGDGDKAGECGSAAICPDKSGNTGPCSDGYGSDGLVPCHPDIPPLQIANDVDDGSYGDPQANEYGLHPADIAEDADDSKSNANDWNPLNIPIPDDNDDIHGAIDVNSNDNTVPTDTPTTDPPSNQFSSSNDRCAISNTTNNNSDLIQIHHNSSGDDLNRFCSCITTNPL